MTSGANATNSAVDVLIGFPEPARLPCDLDGVAVFLICAVAGLFSRFAIAVRYVAHGVWDLSHCLAGSSLAGLSLTDIPLGYGIFCSTFDFVVAGYLMVSDTAWHEAGKFNPYFWRHSP